MKSFLFWLALCLSISLISTEEYIFQRVIECEKGQFEIVNQHEVDDINDEKIEANIEQKVSRSQKVRCKKWMQSYRVIQEINSHLRKQQYNDNSILRQRDNEQGQHSPLRALLEKTSEQIIGGVEAANIDTQPQSYQHVRRSSYSSSSSSKNNDQKFLSLFMTINMQQNVVIYQG